MAKESLDDLKTKYFEQAQELYDKIQQDQLVIDTFKAAQQSTKACDEEDKRKEKWKTFRSTFAHQLVKLRVEKLPKYTDPTPGSPIALTELFVLNKSVQLNPDQKNFYIAFNVVLHTGRQNHRLVDPATDAPDLLLHKNTVGLNTKAAKRT
jgi:hypothetical protein